MAKSNDIIDNTLDYKGTDFSHWSEKRVWIDAIDRFYSARDNGLQKFEIDLTAVEKVIYNGDGPAYELMEAMISVARLEGYEGYKGAPRLVLALLMRLHELSNNLEITGGKPLVTNKMNHIHPRSDDQGSIVRIHKPSIATPLIAFADASNIAVVLPDGETPDTLNGIEVKPWTSAPKTLAGWLHVKGQVNINEPAMMPKQGKKIAAGVVTVEADGRFWVVAPTNAFGGYKTTFPKGTIEAGMNPQATAIKEAYEESGLQVEITDWIGDFERTTSFTRYYFAHRIGGNPAAMGWESQAVMLVPKNRLLDILNHANDHALVTAIKEKL